MYLEDIRGSLIATTAGFLPSANMVSLVPGIENIVLRWLLQVELDFLMMIPGVCIPPPSPPPSLPPTISAQCCTISAASLPVYHVEASLPIIPPQYGA